MRMNSQMASQITTSAMAITAAQPPSWMSISATMGRPMKAVAIRPTPPAPHATPMASTARSSTSSTASTGTPITIAPSV